MKTVRSVGQPPLPTCQLPSCLRMLPPSGLEAGRRPAAAAGPASHRVSREEAEPLRRLLCGVKGKGRYLLIAYTTEEKGGLS